MHALAQKIAAAVTPAHTLSIEMKDVTPGAPVGLGHVRQALESEILVQGGRPVSPSPESQPADAQVRVTISRNIESYLLVAEIRLRDSLQVAIAGVAPADEPAPQPGAVPSIQRRIVWRQSRPILDFAEATTDARHTIWYVLEPDELVAHEFSSGAPVLEQARVINPLGASRDPRGRLQLGEATNVSAWIGGSRCEGRWNPSFTLDCNANQGQLWPMGAANWVFDPPSNHFTGGMVMSYDLAVKYPPLYSAASPSSVSGGQSTSRWVIAGLDGEAQLFSGTSGAAASFTGWGSDLVSLAPVCGSSWQVLVTGSGDWTQTDRLQLYEIADRRAIPAGEALDVSGPILALWPAGDGKSARMVSRILDTGMYEASIVTVSCER